MASVGLVSHPDYLKHETAFGHPERPERLRAIQHRLESTGLMGRLTPIEPRHAEEPWLEKVHSPEHVANVKSRCESGQMCMEDLETMICPRSFEVACLAVGGTFAAVDEVMRGGVDTAFCAVRPPGHHAERDRAMGFCLLNNVAVAARYIQEAHGLERVLIIDWDVHHGNGTQHIFERDPTVFYFSLHQYPHYPWYSGGIEETGTGPGQGTTMNAPMEAGAGDAEHLKAFDERLNPAVERFQPEFVIISAGFDAHESDPLSSVYVTENGFGEMTRRSLAIARSHAEGRMISVLEGGYDLDGMSRCVETHLQVLLEA